MRRGASRGWQRHKWSLASRRYLADSIRKDKQTILTHPIVRREKGLTFQQVYRLPHIGHAEMLGQRRIAAGHCLVHGVRHVAIREVSGGGGAQPGDVERFGEIHFEE